MWYSALEIGPVPGLSSIPKSTDREGETPSKSSGKTLGKSFTVDTVYAYDMSSYYYVFVFYPILKRGYMPKIMSSKSTTKEGLVSLQYPTLSRTNYSAWAMKMKVYLRAQGVWDAIESTESLDSLDERNDQMALAAIYQAIPEEMLFLLAEKETAKEAWQMLKTIHVGAERVKEAKFQTLKFEFEIMNMKESETIDDCVARLTEVINKIRTFGDKFEEANLVKKFLHSVPPKFLHIASAIEQFADLKVMTMEEVIGRLKAYEERIGGNKENVEHVLLTQGEWKAKERSDNGGHSRGRGCSGRWRGRGHGRGNDSFHQEKKADKSKIDEKGGSLGIRL
ncbi:uncharacterized protein LOC111432621 [Cucurbita moschata]|uniref:Uncharacterized protein LOC111432621 n=1 Tax=Cucurbita moschata TaxID=3662 RepID=A0A6J1EBX7_CUCMO|nr:uncharacterized protein LOC111432621 [Cucurbita moschata]